MTPSIMYLHILQRELISIWFKNNCMFFYFPHLIQLNDVSTSKQWVGIILSNNGVHTFTYVYCKEKLSLMWFGSNCMFFPLSHLTQEDDMYWHVVLSKEGVHAFVNVIIVDLTMQTFYIEHYLPMVLQL
jgi:hypothetical protein